MLAADELTILTSWAEAVAEALTFAPGRVEAVAADAQAGAPWRAGLRIREPSPSLSRAINGMAQAARAAAAAGDPPLDAILRAANDRQAGPSALNALARAVLRSALQQRHTRPTSESGPAPHGDRSRPD